MKFHPYYPLIIIVFSCLLVFLLLYVLPFTFFSPQQMPPQSVDPNVPYDYYIIVDEVDGHSLMYVPLAVHIGDEVVTEENKRYKIIKIEGNHAFAKFIEKVELKKEPRP